VLRLLQGGDNRLPKPQALPVVLTPDPPRASGN
jgi:hypothetical protein